VKGHSLKMISFAGIMSVYITSLNSGSNGNCYYVGSADEAVLIDVGISCMETEKRMKQLGLPIKNVKAIFVSHEHGDHIKGVSTLANKYNLPVYISALTASKGPRLIRHLSKPFVAKEPIAIGELLVTPFLKQHDACDPHSFIVRHRNITVGVFTDIGTLCSDVCFYFKQCTAAFLEANYDETLLANGPYSAELKKRISGADGHLSNKQALELFALHRHEGMSHLLLSHLSAINNSAQLVEDLFTPIAANTQIHVLSRKEASAIFTIAAAD
jgi:phosphoribosyl 1,2-cyclic phosphodiesterase